MPNFKRYLLCSLLFAATVAAAQSGAPPRGQVNLPEAPDSHLLKNQDEQGQPHAVVIPRYKYLSGVVEPDQKVHRMTVRDKLLFPLHEEFQWTSAVPIVFSAGYGVLTDDDPKYGTNPEAFGQRLGAEALHQVSTRVFSDGVLPVLFHEDPRYYRQAYGTYMSRTRHALRRVVISQRDSGAATFNFSDVLGRGMGAALTQAYYPDASRSPDVVFRTWGISVLALAGGNLVEEFWPDVRARLFHHD